MIVRLIKWGFYVLLLSASSFSQAQITRDTFLTYLQSHSNVGNITSQYVVSPWLDWVLAVNIYNTDSAVVYLIPYSDTLHQIQLNTFYPKLRTHFGVNVGGNIGGFYEHISRSWDLLQNKVYILVCGSTINQIDTLWECYSIDVSRYCGVKIPNMEFTKYTSIANNYLINNMSKKMAINIISNPVLSGSKIVFQLNNKSFVVVNIYDCKGELVNVLGFKDYESGKITIYWDGTNYQGAKVSDGAYYYQIVTKNMITAKSAIFIHN